MERKILVNRIVGFYFETGVLDEAELKKDEIKIVVDDCLNKVEHIETIITTIIRRARTYKKLDVEKLKEMLLELERLRLELEYKDYAKVS